MHIYTVSIREETYHLDLATIFSKKDHADTYAERLRSLGHEVVVDRWAVNDSLPEWDGEE